MGVIDDIYTIIAEQKDAELKAIFKTFKIPMTDKNHIVFPESFRNKIPEGHDRIHFSKDIKDEIIMIEKPSEDIKPCLVYAPFIGENNEIS